ncbi:uncharacterized protein BDV14DRAFT_164415 [Aspergillus stella-maris]|uniref:uncharacterized protein n=1 Tax=Aspergillus stella-maris TaxID=1810926 RepID=UPI003CCD400E
MQPNHYDHRGQAQDEPRYTPGRVTRDALQSRSGVPSRSEDSWIEVSSQPSSSSFSSAATTDDIITTGLRVQQTESGHHHRRDRRRRLQRLAAVTTAQVEYSSHEPSSSQDEYEESESESDRVMTSSNEDIVRPSQVMGPSLSTAPDVCPSSDEDDSSTALGMRVSASPFVPQPNAFSHPPASENPSWTGRSATSRSRPISDVSTSSRRTAIRRNSQQASSRASQRLSNQQHSPYNVISPSHHADHDAALRASLSTLLSCAAAARGLPKSDAQPTSSGHSRVQPASFRLVSEPVVMDEEVEKDVLSNTEVPTPPRAQRAWQAQQTASPYSPGEISSGRAKRRSSTSKDRGSNHSVAKKSRRTGTTESSSAVMTWVISAGVVVLFSAISFSAGYVLGREVGRLEAGTGMGSVLGDAASPSSRASVACGQEAVRGGLKRFRWSPGAAGSGVIS